MTCPGKWPPECCELCKADKPCRITRKTNPPSWIICKRNRAEKEKEEKKL